MKQFYKVTPEIKNDLKKEIDFYMAKNGFTWSTIRQAKRFTGLPVGWRSIYSIYNDEPQQIKLTSDTLFLLLSFFGFKITFKLSKNE